MKGTGARWVDCEVGCGGEEHNRDEGAPCTLMPDGDARLSTATVGESDSCVEAFKPDVGPVGGDRTVETDEAVTLASAPSTLLRTGTVMGDVADATAPKAPRLLILHPAQFARWQAGREGRGDDRWWWIRKAPGDRDAIDRGAVLNEALFSGSGVVKEGSTQTE
ncbi:hypothetical protein E2C01_092830 [Portunus trituberculatus]|uniref:Uncharacterized protein n=1 Tax=Portunus trituberculatus TaxID=210409 RepID=A0A5B7JN57_PORTR|nr:hypothetical protein [Portunus trituberculatus]